MRIGNTPVNWIDEWSPHPSLPLQIPSVIDGFSTSCSYLNGEIKWEDYDPGRTPLNIGKQIFHRVLSILFRHNNNTNKDDCSKLAAAISIADKILDEAEPDRIITNGQMSSAHRELIFAINSLKPIKSKSKFLKLPDYKRVDKYDQLDEGNGHQEFQIFKLRELELLHWWLSCFPLRFPFVTIRAAHVDCVDYAKPWDYDNWMKWNLHMLNRISKYESLLTEFYTECRNSGGIPSAVSNLAGHYLTFSPE